MNYKKLLIDTRESQWVQVRYILHYSDPGNTIELSAENMTIATGLETFVDFKRVDNYIELSLKLKMERDPSIDLPCALSIEIVRKNSSGKLLIPGMWYNGNPNTGMGAPNYRLSDSWSFREDRLPIPGVGYSDEKCSIVVFHENLPKVDGAYPHEEEIVVTSDKAPITEIGSVGFRREERDTIISFRTPYSESPWVYSKKLEFTENLNPVGEHVFRRLKTGESLILKLRMFMGEALSFSDLMARTIEKAFGFYLPEFLHADLSNSEIRKILSNYWNEAYFQTSRIRAFAGKGLDTFNEILTVHHMEIGFLGRNILNAVYCLDYGIESEDYKYQEMGIWVIESAIKDGRNGDCFLEGYNTENDEWDSVDTFSLRRQAEGTMALYEACQLNFAAPECWMKAFRQTSDYLASLQCDDGHLPHSFNAHGGILDDDGRATAVVIPLLLLNDRKRAIKAGNYVLENIISKDSYSSLSLDSSCEDKESGLIACSAMIALHQAVKDDRWLDAAKRAADYTLSWYYLWDVPFADGTLLKNIEFKTSGWGNVSIENNHVDCYLFDFSQSLFYLSSALGVSLYREYGLFIYHSIVSRLIQYENKDAGLKLNGFVPEVVQQTAWDYGSGGKGTYNHINAFGWTNVSILTAVKLSEKNRHCF